MTINDGCRADKRKAREAEDRAGLRDDIKAAIKTRAMDRFASDFLADDAREWLAGFAADAALDTIRAAGIEVA